MFVSREALERGMSAPQRRVVPNGHYLIHPARADTLAHALHVEALAMSGALAEPAQPEANTTMRGQQTENPFGYRIDNGAAIIPVMGTLISRGAFVGNRYGVTSYEGLRSELRRASNDSRVDRIVLAIDSPGGSVSGIDSAAEAIRAASAMKPVVAHVEGMAASAAYWLASQADEIVMTPLSEVGSIGVVSMHVDYSKVIADMGLNVTLIYSGAHKVDGNPFEPLPESVRADWQAEVDRLRGSFAQAVAEGRPLLAVEGALSTEARMFPSDDAIRLGMADRVGSLDAVVSPSAAIHARLYRAQQNEDTTMANEQTAPASGDNAAAAALARAQAILAAPEAQGRDALARALAFEPAYASLTTEQAVAMLALAPAAAAPAAPAPAAPAAAAPVVPPVAARSADVSQLNAGEPAAAPVPNASALWDKAVAKVNRRVEGKSALARV